MKKKVSKPVDEVVESVSADDVIVCETKLAFTLTRSEVESIHGDKRLTILASAKSFWQNQIGDLASEDITIKGL